jgi:hypothetical protein
MEVNVLIMVSEQSQNDVKYFNIESKLFQQKFNLWFYSNVPWCLCQLEYDYMAFHVNSILHSQPICHHTENIYYCNILMLHATHRSIIRVTSETEWTGRKNPKVFSKAYLNDFIIIQSKKKKKKNLITSTTAMLF